MSYNFPVFPLLLLAALFRHFALDGFSKKQTSPTFAFFQNFRLLIVRINKHLHKIFERILKKELERRYFLLTQPAQRK